MMMKFMDFLNTHFANVDKKDFTYECSYIWTSLFKNLIIIGILLLGLFIVAMFAVLITADNLNQINSDWAQWFNANLNFMYKPEIKPHSLETIIVMDLVLLGAAALIVLNINMERIGTLIDRTLDKFCRKIPK